MDHQKWSLRAGVAVILCACLLRLSAGGLFQPLVDFFSRTDISSFLVYLETGRTVRLSDSGTALPAFRQESSPPDFAVGATAPVFSADDAAGIEIKNSSSRTPEVSSLLETPLDWDLTGEEPTVLILHTHATESYTPSPEEDYQETSPFRTLDENYNMISVGDHLAALLEAGGLTVLHDRALHDYPSYNGSYNHARKSIAQYLEEYPSIRLVLDLHRDASGDNHNQMVTRAEVDGKTSAQLMLVVGTNSSGLTHPNWEENLALALKLYVQLERTNQGICRYVNLRAQRFNQDQCPGALLVEVGAAGNTHAEALTAAEVLAEGILALAKGSS